MRDKVKNVTVNQGGGFYFMGMIGSAVYWVQHAHGFWWVVLALLKALVWPAFVVYEVLGLLHL